MPEFVTTEAELEAIYGQPAGPAVIKEIDHISDHYRRFIETSPFVVLATSGPEGLDCTPRGDPRGFVRVVDSRTVMLPDRRGNNRIDTLRNIVRDPRIALLFLIPGIGRSTAPGRTPRASSGPMIQAPTTSSDSTGDHRREVFRRAHQHLVHRELIMSVVRRLRRRRTGLVLRTRSNTTIVS